MHRFVLLYVGLAAFLTGWAITEAQYRVTHTGHLVVPDPYLPLLHTVSLGLWLVAALAVAAKQNRDAAAGHQAEQTERIEQSVRKCTEAVLSDVDERKRAEINSMLSEYGIETEKRNGAADEAGRTQPLNLIQFRQKGAP